MNGSFDPARTLRKRRTLERRREILEGVKLVSQVQLCLGACQFRVQRCNSGGFPPGTESGGGAPTLFHHPGPHRTLRSPEDPTGILTSARFIRRDPYPPHIPRPPLAPPHPGLLHSRTIHIQILDDHQGTTSSPCSVKPKIFPGALATCSALMRLPGRNLPLLISHKKV